MAASPLHFLRAGSAVRAAVSQAYCPRPGVDRQRYHSAAPHGTEVQPLIEDLLSAP